MSERSGSRLSELIADIRVVDQLGDSLPGLVYVYDLVEQTNVYVNRALAERLGHTPEEVIALGAELLTRVIHPDDLPHTIAHHAKLSAVRDAPAESEQSLFEVEYRIRQPDGEWRWLHSWETVLGREPDGRPRLLLGVAQDITDRVQTEDELRNIGKQLVASEQRWRSIVENPFDFVVVIDRQYRYTFINFAAPGVNPDDLLGKMTPLEFMAKEDWPRVTAAFEEAFTNGKPTSYEIYVPPLDKWYLSMVGPIREGHEVTHASILTREITVEKRAQLELARKNAELERALEIQRSLEAKLTQSAKLEAVGRLAGGIAHDFNNLLTGINGVVEVISLRLGTDEQSASDVADLREAVKRGAALTRQLLAFSRQQSIDPVVVDLNTLIGNTSRMLARLIGSGVELTWKPGAGAWTVLCEPSQIEQVLLNLTVNARDAMPGGGKLSLQTTNVTVDAAYCEQQPDARAGDFVCISVTDTGTGMDAATLARIFEPFFTTKPVGSGTGLGLATVYGIVAQARGFVHVYTELGHGTSFKVYLPRALGSAALEPPPSRKERGGTESILVVEDEELVLKLTQRLLEGLGYRVHTAPRGDRALELIQAGLEFDLLLTDVMLPGLDGPEVYRRAVLGGRTFPVVFMSGYADNLMGQKGVLGDGVAFLQKPFTADELAAKVRAGLQARKSCS